MKIFLFLNLFFSFNLFLFSKEIKIKTPDGCILYAYENIISTKNPILLEIHGLGSNKEEWNIFNSFLKEEKINSLAIDLRGHGKSLICKNNILNYKDFNLNYWENILIDIKTSYDYLKKTFNNNKIILIGASIGSNASLILSKSEKINKIILLSPGLIYGPFKIKKEHFDRNKKILILTSKNDAYSYNSVEIFKEFCQKENINCQIIEALNGHGVQIFENKKGKDYIKKILDWIKLK